MQELKKPPQMQDIRLKFLLLQEEQTLQDHTDVESFSVLEPIADGFRNYTKNNYDVEAEKLLVDKAQLMTLTAPR